MIEFYELMQRSQEILQKKYQTSMSYQQMIKDAMIFPSEYMLLDNNYNTGFLLLKANQLNQQSEISLYNQKFHKSFDQLIVNHYFIIVKHRDNSQSQRYFPLIIFFIRFVIRHFSTLQCKHVSVIILNTGIIIEHQLFMPQSKGNFTKPTQIRDLLIVILLLLSFCNSVNALTSFKVYPLADDYFEKIYLVSHNDQQYYLTISCKMQDMLSLSITKDRNFIQAPRFNIYGNSQNKPKMGRGVYTFLKQCRSYVEVNTPNFLQVKRSKDGDIIFSLSEIIFKQFHNRFVLRDESIKWGLGQRFQKNFHVADGTWTIWNRDKPWMMDEGSKGVSQQTYGHHPIYLARARQSKLYHLVYYKNTFGLLVQSSQNSDQLIFNSVGGNIQFLVILGKQDPEEVLEKYHEYIGKSHIPPFWSLGYHQCRWGYKTLRQIAQVVNKFNQNDLPLDTMWSDLDYMDRKMIFTINEATHPPAQLNQLMREQQIHFVPLIDVGVSVNDWPAMNLGKQMNVFLKQSNEYYTAQVWPGIVHFVDYLHPNATKFWKRQLGRLKQKINFSGIWLDMNEPSNFRGGQPAHQPFKIQQNQNINMMTINVGLKHYTQMKGQILQHRQVHAYYGHLSTIPTHEFLAEHQRPFIISRSNSVGSGQFAGHWTGDNVATWDFLRSSINGNFLFQIFGIHMVGADICGFYQNPTEQLCARWMQLGSFYPFSRNHHWDQGRSQQPYSYGQMLLKTSKKSLKTRYALLKQLYTILLDKKGKGSFFRPLIFEFYRDEEAYYQETVQTQFLIGKLIMVAPIVYQNKMQREVYFPGENEEWFQFQINSLSGQVQAENVVSFKGKSKDTIQNPLPSAPLAFLRGGYAILTNIPQNRSIKLSRDYHLFAALKNDESSAQILGINDYNFEPHIQKCISDNCSFLINLKKSGQSKFILEWKFIGSSQLMGSLNIKSLLIVSSDKKWKLSNNVEINAAQGQIELHAEEYNK